MGSGSWEGSERQAAERAERFGKKGTGRADRISTIGERERERGSFVAKSS